MILVAVKLEASVQTKLTEARSGQEVGVCAGPESHGREVNGFLGVGVR